MIINILTLFPDIIEHAANASILGRAIANGRIKLNIVNIRDFSTNRHLRVDDYPYGGGAGMVIEAEPVFRCVQFAKELSQGDTRVIYLTPQAKVLDQHKAEELAKEKSLTLLCGHYEGIDERVLEEVVTDYVSIGDYVLTGGELPALVLMDAVARFVPGVLGNEESSQFESLQDNLLEYPHYTRPQNWRGKEVPEILLCGDHKKIEKWRYEQALARTAQNRPDLLRLYKRLHVMFFGSDEAADLANKVCAAVSRHGEVLDYRRNKLRKSRREFGTEDMVIIVCQGTGGLEDIKEGMRKVDAKDTAIFCIFTDVSEISADHEKELSVFLSEKGFLYGGAYECNEEDERIDEIALDIRKSTKHKLFTF